jgi:ADP-ribose pyrophosphatase
MRKNGPWQVHATREVYRDPWMTVEQDRVTRPDGRPGTFCLVHIKPGVTVLALDDTGRVHLAEEFRYAVGRRTLEAVSGGIDDGEAPEAAARRELKEELGIEAAEWTDLGRTDPFTSMVLSPARLFLARGLTIGRTEHEGTEVIRRVEMPLADAVAAVMDGRITHAPSCVVILKAEHLLRAPSPRAAS